MRRRMMLCAAVSVLAVSLAAAPAHAQLFGGGGVVYDPANHAENILTAARTLEMIAQQVEQIENQARMLIHQAQNLEGLDHSSAHEIATALGRVNALVERAEGIAFLVAEAEAEYARLYPETADGLGEAQMLANARARWGHSRDALGHALAVQAEIAGSVADDAATLDALLAESQGAAGNLDATQAGNQLTALSIKQALQTQQLMAVQARAETLERARAVAAAEEARVRRERFLGDGDAYGPEG